MKKALMSVFLSFLALYTHGNPESLFEQGNEMYRNKNYHEAVNFYKQVVDMGVENAFLYYNMGNAYYKLGQTAPSILYFEKAIRLDPANDDIAFNLELARLRAVDRIDTGEMRVAPISISGLAGRLSGDLWAIVTLGALWAALICGLIALFIRPGIRMVPILPGILLLLIALFAFYLSHLKGSLDRKESNYAILFAEEVVIKSEPDFTGNDLFRLHEGAKMEILDAEGEWRKIRFDNNKVGWIEGEYIELI